MVVSIRGTMPVIYVVEADKELEEMLIEQEAAFWHLVQTKTPPEPVTYSDMVARFRKSVPYSVMVTDEIKREVEVLRLIRANQKDLEVQEERCKTAIMRYMGENSALVDYDETALITWRTAKSTRRFNLDRFKKEQPDIYEHYLLEGEPSRRFLIK